MYAISKLGIKVMCSSEETGKLRVGVWFNPYITRKATPVWGTPSAINGNSLFA
jgi:hypothetical protein